MSSSYYEIHVPIRILFTILCNIHNILYAEVYEGVIDPPIAKAPLRHVSAPEPKAPQSAPNQNICGDCERLIV